jgi:hypothetical protein
MADDSIVMPRSCSSGLESRYRILPASLGDMMPFVAIRASVREVLPWSCLDVSTKLTSGGLYKSRDLELRARTSTTTLEVFGRTYDVRKYANISNAFRLLLQGDELFWSHDRHVRIEEPPGAKGGCRGSRMLCTESRNRCEAAFQKFDVTSRQSSFLASRPMWLWSISWVKDS